MAGKPVTAPATHSQPSRKGKKAWRKNVDLSEVQGGLETVRDEIIQGGVIAERESDQLFTTDVLGDAEIERKSKNKKLLRADDIIAQRSAVPGIEKRKRKGEELETFTTGKKQKNGTYISHRELQRLKMVAGGTNGGMHLDERVEHDPWDAPAAPVMDERFSFLEPPKDKVAPKSLKQAPVPLTASGKPLASVRKPEAGKSYNPLVGDWSALFEREGAAAVEAEKARLQAEFEQEERERNALEEAARVEEAEKDAFATDYESAWESEWDGIQSEGEKEIHTKKVAKRKTPQERNKIKARKEREQKEKWEKKQKQRNEQEKHIKKIARELSAKDRAIRPGTLVSTGNDSSDSDENNGPEQYKKRRFGQIAIPEAPLEVTLPEDLEDSLRRLKPEGNLLTDRYRNLLINGKLEVRKPVGQRKQKQTYRTEKWTYKDWELK
ncbi:unnamed protein product [Zymoseptoria tritici ST99CH_1A5]|uniref:Ribosome biogenesis protein NOP53 n=1 Tax=Zymoseptoria tritici ST99CH_1A5 TaxID=1276529 RepID=A0A1Y6LWH6_ZYMTR|nr:unnamed protein product [Zymoseptoria tritici ST99CH_1A5]